MTSSERSNVIPLFPDKAPDIPARSKMDRHHQSAMEVMIIAVANRRSVEADVIEQELCVALGVNNVEDLDPLKAQAWLGGQMAD